MYKGCADLLRVKQVTAEERQALETFQFEPGTVVSISSPRDAEEVPALQGFTEAELEGWVISADEQTVTIDFYDFMSEESAGTAVVPRNDAERLMVPPWTIWLCEKPEVRVLQLLADMSEADQQSAVALLEIFAGSVKSKSKS